MMQSIVATEDLHAALREQCERKRPCWAKVDPRTVVLDVKPLEPISVAEDEARVSDVWTFESADGRSVFASDVIERSWFRPPFYVELRLVESGDANRGRVLSSAVIGTRVEYRKYLQRVNEALCYLLQSAVAQETGSPKNDIAGGEVRSLARPRIGMGGLRQVRERWESRLQRERWVVGLCERNIDAVMQNRELGAVNWIEARPCAGSLADPFPLRGTEVLLCEEVLPGSGKGRIVQIRLNEAKRVIDIVPALEANHHISYPFVFEHGAATYLMPESHQARTTSIYQLRSGEKPLLLHRVLEGRRIVDATLFRHQDLWWLFCCDVDVNPYDALLIFMSEDLAGPWRPHPKNPVKLDIRSARPAGALFRHGRSLFRPAQDCSETYGGALAINEVEVLSTISYQETTRFWIKPERTGRAPDGLHTFSLAGDKVVVDGKSFYPDPLDMIRRGLGKLGRKNRA